MSMSQGMVFGELLAAEAGGPRALHQFAEDRGYQFRDSGMDVYGVP